MTSPNQQPPSLNNPPNNPNFRRNCPECLHANSTTPNPTPVTYRTISDLVEHMATQHPGGTMFWASSRQIADLDRVLATNQLPSGRYAARCEISGRVLRSRGTHHSNCTSTYSSANLLHPGTSVGTRQSAGNSKSSQTAHNGGPAESSAQYIPTSTPPGRTNIPTLDALLAALQAPTPGNITHPNAFGEAATPATGPAPAPPAPRDPTTLYHDARIPTLPQAPFLRTAEREATIYESEHLTPDTVRALGARFLNTYQDGLCGHHAVHAAVHGLETQEQMTAVTTADLNETRAGLLDRITALAVPSTYSALPMRSRAALYSILISWSNTEAAQAFGDGRAYHMTNRAIARSLTRHVLATTSSPSLEQNRAWLENPTTWQQLFEGRMRNAPQLLTLWAILTYATLPTAWPELNPPSATAAGRTTRAWPALTNMSANGLLLLGHLGVLNGLAIIRGSNAVWQVVLNRDDNQPEIQPSS